MSERPQEKFNEEKFEAEATRLLNLVINVDTSETSKSWKELQTLIVDSLRSTKGNRDVLELFHALIMDKSREMRSRVPNHIHRRMLETVIISIVKEESEEKSDLNDGETSKRVDDVLPT